LEQGFRNLLDEYGEGEIPITEMIDKLMRNTEKDDISMLPRIYNPEFEYELSSIFVKPISIKVNYKKYSAFLITHLMEFIYIHNSNKLTFFIHNSNKLTFFLPLMAISNE